LIFVPHASHAFVFRPTATASSKGGYPSKFLCDPHLKNQALLANAAALFFQLRVFFATQSTPFISAITRLLALLNSDSPVRIFYFGLPVENHFLVNVDKHLT
jgi:hypothetical protein